MTCNKLTLSTIACNNKGLTIFAIGSNSNAVSQIVRSVHNGETDIKPVVLTHEEPIEVAFDKFKGKQDSTDVPKEHTNTVVSEKSFDEANAAAMRRAPQLVMLGSIDGKDEVLAAIELALQDIRVVATTKPKSISSIIPDIISLFPTEARASKACELISYINMLVADKVTDEKKSLIEQQYLVFDEALKTELLISIKDNGYCAETLSQRIDNAVESFS